ncbi:MAG: glycosyltransferase family 39 protein [Flavipsychrobacter sp.]|nr:glycosyltransferase family 39 protein [Flavipsychrobacter sp.]
MILKDRRVYLLLIVLLATFMAFWKCGVADLNDWDEARNGVNAYEMYHNKDFVNLYYNGIPDTWNAKPPLMTWLIVVCYHLFGFNEFALRLPSVISSVVFFIFFFKLIEKLEAPLTAFLTCLILLSCKAVLGTHVGITGDYDALLLCLLTISAYYFVLYAECGKANAIFGVALFTGLAFYTKGTAAFIYLPGFFMYLLYRQKFRQFIKDRRTWMALLLFVIICTSWVGLILLHGQYNTQSFYGSKNALETMLFHDTIRRLASTNFEQVYVPDHFFFFTTIDSRLNLWNYLFYVSVLTGLVILYHNRKFLLVFIKRPSNRLTLFSLFLATPLVAVLTVATNKHAWYLAPAFGCIAFVTVKGLMYLTGRWKPLFAICCCLFVFAISRQFFYLSTRPHELHDMFNPGNAYFKQCKQVVIANVQPAQRIFLYLEWLDIPLVKTDRLSIAGLNKNIVLVLKKDQLVALPLGGVKTIGYFDDCCLLVVE